MRNILAFSLFLGLAGSLLGADDPFAGTWKFNLDKTKPDPAQVGRLAKEQTTVIQFSAGTATVTNKGIAQDGSAFSSKYSTPATGGPVTYEPALPAGMSAVSKRIDKRTVEIVTTRDGKEVSRQHTTISSDGKTLRNLVKGVNAKGESYQNEFVFDKQ